MTEEIELTCLICYEQITNSSIIQCNSSHMYHNNCIYMWLKINNTCPFCKINAYYFHMVFTKKHKTKIVQKSALLLN
jgi:hypothetical protein